MMLCNLCLLFLCACLSIILQPSQSAPSKVAPAASFEADVPEVDKRKAGFQGGRGFGKRSGGGSMFNYARGFGKRLNLAGARGFGKRADDAIEGQETEEFVPGETAQMEKRLTLSGARGFGKRALNNGWTDKDMWRLKNYLQTISARSS